MKAPVTVEQASGKSSNKEQQAAAGGRTQERHLVDAGEQLWLSSTCTLLLDLTALEVEEGGERGREEETKKSE